MSCYALYNISTSVTIVKVHLDVFSLLTNTNRVSRHYGCMIISVHPIHTKAGGIQKIWTRFGKPMLNSFTRKKNPAFSHFISSVWNVTLVRAEMVSWYTEIQSGKGRCPWTSACCSILCYTSPHPLCTGTITAFGGEREGGIWLPSQPLP